MLGIGKLQRTLIIQNHYSFVRFAIAILFYTGTLSGAYRKQAQSARGRYVSAEKVQELFAQLGIELCAGRKRIRAARSDKSISIYVNGGTVNITFNEKGGKA